MLGSIFPGKLIFADGKHRTVEMSLAFSLIYKKRALYKMKKPETPSFLKMFPEICR
ncbi:hypothetical protein NEOC95_001375 [Neochlamydia sp. AcF95]|nr:hypothetical protein [Neochlamydia sp. AcF95]